MGISKKLTDGFLAVLPATWARKLGFKLLRGSSGEFRAFTELFLRPYSEWIEWRSGIGDGVFLLHAIVRAETPEVVVEIGSARGRSTSALALACRQNGRGKVYAIDPHIRNEWTDRGTEGDNEAFLRARLRDYELDDWCELIRATSRDAAKSWSKPIDLLFIDGDHTYEGVKHDFEAFQPWLTERALVLFHDTAWEHLRTHEGYRSDMGVPRYLDELQRDGYQSVTFRSFPGLTILHARPGGFTFLPEEASPRK